MEIRLNPRSIDTLPMCRCVVVLCPHTVMRWSPWDGWRMERDDDWSPEMRWRVISAAWPRVGPEALEEFA